MKKTPKQYNITPAKGQALLNFQGRRFPDKIDLFEAEVIEKVKNNKAKETSLFTKETDLNSDFNNLLIHGDCLSACAYLKSQNIKVDLVYIDPPFASGANYAKKIYLRNGVKSAIESDDNTIGEEVMYGDIWQKEDYLNWLYERLLAIKDVMNDTGSIYVHLDWHIGHYVKILLDEVFGEENFNNEVVWCYAGREMEMKKYNPKHDVIYFYSINSGKIIFNIDDIRAPYTEATEKKYRYEDEKGKFQIRGKAIGGSPIDRADGLAIEYEKKYPDLTYRQYYKGGTAPRDWWQISMVNKAANERTDYATQKPEALLERIIKASSNEGMIVADFFSGSGTAAKVANDLNRKFIACDIGINALQTTRDRLVKAGTNFNVIKINDGLRLFRNPAQTTAQIFSLIDGFKSRTALDLTSFWDGGIAHRNGSYTPVKFTGIHEKLTKELLDVYLEEIYNLEDTTDHAHEIVIIYAFKEIQADQKYLNLTLNKIGKTELKVKLVSLDSLLGEKKDALFTPDNAAVHKTKQGRKYKVAIKKYKSSYLYKKLEDYNAKKTKAGTVCQDFNKAVKISNTGLEMIEAVQFDTTCEKVWRSNPDLEDKAGIKEKIKAVYMLDTDKFKMKIRNIAGDEIIIDSGEITCNL